jgi:hypothetical protein
MLLNTILNIYKRRNSHISDRVLVLKVFVAVVHSQDVCFIGNNDRIHIGSFPLLFNLWLGEGHL